MTQRIHIVGSSPRTGTTLLTELMRHGFEIDGVTAHEVRLRHVPPQPYRTYLTKNPSDVLIARRYLRVDPNLWILHMVRDPRDVVVSRHGRAPDRYWTNLALWQRYRRAARRLEGHPRVLTIRYEDLIDDPDAVQTRIAAFLPFLARSRHFSEVHRVSEPDADSIDALGGVRPVSDASIGAWRAHLPRIAAQLARHGSIDRDLVELGYETDSSWREHLVGVEPANGESHLSETVTWRRRALAWRKARRKLRGYASYARENASDAVTAAAPGPFHIQLETTRAGQLEIGVLGEGPTVVAVPSLGRAGTEQFGALAEALADAGFRTVAVNPRGIGASRGPLLELSLGDLAQDLLDAIIDRTGPVHLVGAAFGNRVVRTLAQAHPESVRSLALIAAGGKFPPLRGSSRTPRPRPWPDAARAQQFAAREAPLESWWSGGSAPTLVVQGLADVTAPPENGRALAAEFPSRVQLLELPRVGHGPLEERPDLVIPAITRFVRQQHESQASPKRGAPEGESHSPSGARSRWWATF